MYEVIKKVGNKYVLYPKKGGKRLGTHDTKKSARNQEKAVKASKYEHIVVEKTGCDCMYVSVYERVDENQWSKKYKKKISCSNPKGFSQKAHCDGRKARQRGEKTISKSVSEQKMTDKQQYDYLVYMRKYKPDIWRDLQGNKKVKKIMKKFESVNESGLAFAAVLRNLAKHAHKKRMYNKMKKKKHTKESDLPTTSKKEKTVRAVHKTSGKELVYVDTPSTRKKLKRMGFVIKEGMTKYHIRLTKTPGWYGIWDKNGKQKAEGDRKYITKFLKALKTRMGSFQLKSLVDLATDKKGKDISFDVAESVNERRQYKSGSQEMNFIVQQLVKYGNTKSDAIKMTQKHYNNVLKRYKEPWFIHPVKKAEIISSLSANESVNEVKKLSDKELVDYMLYIRKYKPGLWNHLKKNPDMKKMINKFKLERKKKKKGDDKWKGLGYDSFESVNEAPGKNHKDQYVGQARVKVKPGTYKGQKVNYHDVSMYRDHKKPYHYYLSIRLAHSDGNKIDHVVDTGTHIQSKAGKWAQGFMKRRMSGTGKERFS